MKKIVHLLILITTMNASAIIETHHLVLGEDIRLPLKSYKVWIEESKVIKGEVAGSHLKVTGLKEGASAIGIGEKKYQIYVLHPKKFITQRDLEKSLEKILGLKTRFEKNETIVEGDIYRLDDWKALAEKLQGTEPDYKMRAKISTDVQDKIEKYFDLLFVKNKLPQQEILFGDEIELRLPPKHIYLNSYRNLLSPYGISVIEDSKSISIEPTIKVQITVAEVQRQFTQKIGLRWPDSYQAQILPDAMWNFSSLEAVANFFEQNGHGRVLASPNLICRSGKEAQFLAGGEFPIKVSNYRMQNISWKNYGILLKVKPLADSLGQISLQIETEISSLDDSKAIDGVPGLITHKVSSHFDLRKPQTIALSGLIKNEEGRSSSGLPFLSRVPILGKLFSSQDYKENRTELVIFVRPEVIDLQSPQQPKPKHLSEI